MEEREGVEESASLVLRLAVIKGGGSEQLIGAISDSRLESRCGEPLPCVRRVSWPKSVEPGSRRGVGVTYLHESAAEGR